MISDYEFGKNERFPKNTQGALRIVNTLFLSQIKVNEIAQRNLNAVKTNV